MNQAVAAPRRTNLEVDLDAYEEQIKAVLPAHLSVDKFRRTVMTAVARNPELYMEADRRTLFNACIVCASDGLLPDGREAALVIFNTKDRRTDQWVKAVQYMPMIQGIRKRMRNTGEVADAQAHCIYQNDDFDYELGDSAFIRHKPTLDDRGSFIGAYAIIRLANGEIIREVMNRQEIEKVRAVSKSKDKSGAPWTEWHDEMARKTVLRRAAKAAPSSPDLERLWNSDEAVAEPASAALPPPRPTRESIAEQRQLPQPEPESVDPTAAGHPDLDQQYRQAVDAETGEIAEPAATTAIDWPAMAQMIREGADDQQSVAEIDEYWAVQKAVLETMRAADPKLYTQVYEHVTARRKGLAAKPRQAPR